MRFIDCGIASERHVSSEGAGAYGGLLCHGGDGVDKIRRKPLDFLSITKINGPNSNSDATREAV